MYPMYSGSMSIVCYSDLTPGARASGNALTNAMHIYVSTFVEHHSLKDHRRESLVIFPKDVTSVPVMGCSKSLLSKILSPL